MFTEEETEVSGKAVDCYPWNWRWSGALFIAPAAPWPRTADAPCWNILKSLAGFFVAFFYYVNKGIRRNVGFWIPPNQFLLGNLPWDPPWMPANKLNPQCIWYAYLLPKQNLNSTNTNWVIFQMFVYEWKFLSYPSVTNIVKLLKVYDAFVVQC